MANMANDGDGDCVECGKDSEEFRLLMAYAQRRKPQVPGSLPSSQKRKECSVKMKKKKGWAKLRKVFSCVSAPMEESDQKFPESEGPNESDVQFRMVNANTDELGNVVTKLSSIVDSVHFTPGDIETDSQDDVIQTIVKLLRESGDKLDEEMKTNQSLAKQLQNSLSYSVFKAVTSLFLERVEPSDVPSEENLEQTKIALACEVTSRLTAVDNHPMNRVLGFGAKYLQENFSLWIKEKGGWEKAFVSEDDVQ